MELLLAPQPFLHPELSAQAQAFIRIAYGLLLCGTIALAVPHWRRFFLSERWGGYAQPNVGVERVHNPVVAPLVLTLWAGCGLCIASGLWSPWPAVVNLLICRYYFIAMRWKGLARGMGAPGHVLYWAGICVVLLEYCARYAPELHPLALQVLQVDFAFIYLSSGFYKYSAGYPQNQGMELGMANPAWGYWWRYYVGMPPSHVLFRTLNHLAWSSQIIAGFLMLIPPTRFIGGMIIVGMFMFVGSQIRLGLLCEVVILCSGLIFVHPGSLVDQILVSVIGAVPTPPLQSFPGSDIFNVGLRVFLGAYLILIPLAHAGLSYNFYLRRSLPMPIQRVLEAYTNFFGLIVWRVFSVDLVNFFIRVYRPSEDHPDGRQLISNYGWQGRFRFDHVVESITLACIFTSLKYYPSNNAVFEERLLRYAKTFAQPPHGILLFEYVSVVKEPDRFAFVPVALYAVNLDTATVTEELLNAVISPRAAHAVSPVHEGLRPGTYAPSGGR
ncbi:hypothetical protein W02_13620 [Nitrospira sp. KM1]|uniref:hypothetical protein n=1 Tax=Nitrospira sp. KM1 TaxID=1936990 RepID=UPI0013A74200|nr:hypothetical protein [Nitrospira sp. KM1]BCA54222.1 hypothetical protein W02_13620 [Nitrospira sp. KM1]